MKKRTQRLTMIAVAMATAIITGKISAQTGNGPGQETTVLDCDQTYPIICAQIGSVTYYGRAKKIP
jgi:hypothetical protein